MLKKEVKRMEWGIPEVQPDQRAEAKYLLGIVDADNEDLGGGTKSNPKEEPKEEPKVDPKEEEDEEEDEEEVVETPKKK